MVSETIQIPGTVLEAPAQPWVPANPLESKERRSSLPHPDWTVLENVIEPIAATGVRPTLAFEIATDALDLLDLTRWAGTRFEDLKVSQQQRVMIARTMTMQPSLDFGEWVDATELLQELTAMAP